MKVVRLTIYGWLLLTVLALLFTWLFSVVYQRAEEQRFTVYGGDL